MVADWLKRWLREPLIHFLSAGAAIFVLSSLIGTSVDPSERRIVVTQAKVSQLALNWAQTMQRVPTPVELDGVIRDFIREEVYYREGLRLGLDQDDPIVRRRIRAKMEYMATSQSETESADDATLNRWLTRNPDRYAVGARYAFEQVYIAQGADDRARAQSALALLRRGQSVLSDAIALPSRADAQALDDVARVYGESFAEAVAHISPGAWSGPIVSGFGLHLVRVNHIVVAAPAKLADVRQRVENDWRSATRRAREETAYQTLLDGYRIDIERP